MTEAADWRGAQRVEALERAILILEAFADGSPRLTLSELTQRTGLYRSTLLRLAASLDRGGLLRRDADGRFRLGPTLRRLGALYERSFDLAAEVRPALEALATRSGKTAAFYIREGEDRICLFRRESDHLIRHHLDEGAVLPLDRGAGGRILAAYAGAPGAVHDRVRAQGWHVSRGERDPETASVAAPVFGGDRRLVGALAIVGLLSHFDEAQSDAFIAMVTEAARELSRRLGGG